MTDHVAVLREMREHLAIFAEGAEGARRRGMDGDLAALDHAIAAVEAAEPHVVGDILYRINSYVLTGNLTDAEFRQNAEPIVEDIRGYLSGLGYEVMPETDAKHAALVARLGEFVKKLRSKSDQLSKPYGCVSDHSLGRATALEDCADNLAELVADDLARVVKEGGG